MKTKEKCCADCKHRVRCDDHYGCDITAKRDRISGNYSYKKCEYVIDTPDCNFKDETVRRIIIYVGAMILAIAVVFYIAFNF